MSRHKQRNKPVIGKNFKVISLEDHIDYLEEARAAKKHYFLNIMDIDTTQITNWLMHNSKYYFDTSNVVPIKEIYNEMCSVLINVRNTFNYVIIGKIIAYFLKDNRYYLKPFQFSKLIAEVHETYLSLLEEWDNIVLKQFAFPYKTILSIRYEIKSFILYLTLEGATQKIVQPNSTLSVSHIMRTFLDCLELPMSLYFDSFHLRKLLFQMSIKETPAFALHCIHPVITQTQYVFQLYFKNIQLAWTKIDEINHIPLTLLGFSYLLQSFLIDNYNKMMFWKTEDYNQNLTDNVKPTIVTMLDLSMPLDLIDKLLVQGFYDIIEADCNVNFVHNQFNMMIKDINQWQDLIQAWNEGMEYEELYITKDVNTFLQYFMGLLFERGVKDWSHAYLCMSLVHNFITDKVYDSDHALVVLKYFVMNHWIPDETLHTQIQNWFQTTIDEGMDFGSLITSFEDYDSNF